MADKQYLYPVWVRLWHWLNAILCLMLIITGISMQYSDPSYPIIRFDWAVAIHDYSGIMLTISYIMFVLGNLFTPNGRQYLFRLKSYYKNITRQARYYAFGIFKGEKPPFEITEDNKFNPLQRFSYVVIMYICIPVIIITGIGLLYPEVLLVNIFGNNSLHATDLVHVVFGFVVSIFMIVHIYFISVGKNPASNFASMFTGYHEKH